MKITTEEVKAGVQGLLAKYLESKVSLVSGKSSSAGHAADFVLKSGDTRFVIEYKSSGRTALVAQGIETLSRLRSSNPNVIPLLVVPFMGETGGRLSNEAGISWLDLSGNADVKADGIRVLVSGLPNKFKSRGRPRNPLAPKSSRIARYLLLHPEKKFTQRQLALENQLSEGFTSTTIRRLLELGLVQKDSSSRVFAPDPGRLLDAWDEAYDFSKHLIIRGQIPARSGVSLAERLAEKFEGDKAGYALTGLSAAWFQTQFAAFRLVTVYLRAVPNEEAFSELDFQPEPRGANIWLVIPKDEGVFVGAREYDGIHCVAPVQTYLDLSGQFERSKEAAQQLRKRLLTWD